MKAIVFDFDGLIVDTESIWYDCYRETLSALNLEFPIEVFSRCIGTHDTEMRNYLKEVVGGEAQALQIVEAAARLHDDKILNVQERQGVRDYLEEAKQAGLMIGLASSSSRKWIDRFLDELGLRSYFQTIKTSEDVTNIKPDPELYLRAIESLGVEPSKAVAFEDSVNGAKAAKAAGLRCIIVPNRVTENLLFEAYDLRIRSMGDQPLAELIRQLNEAEGSPAG
ncbi:HAD family hydrolase [Paenibacillus beijingensis]|uniref:HAD family hydrolase n=1 Tax=Paenibacillus beijingensis TaxID=1126833 RepID=UPI0009E20442|nr:HAD family hydrolase [Paenibacillus beijingensis]